MPDITEAYNSKVKRKAVIIKATSSEMRTFTHYVTLIVGQYVPRDEMV